MNEPFGPHLTIDASQCDAEKLKDHTFVYDILDQLPTAIGMTKIMPPYVVTYREGKVPEDWGISGFVMIAESHISIHTFPDKDYVFIDMFSCREFDIDKALDILISAFGAKRVTTNIVQRGLEFPRDMQPVRVMA